MVVNLPKNWLWVQKEVEIVMDRIILGLLAVLLLAVLWACYEVEMVIKAQKRALLRSRPLLP